MWVVGDLIAELNLRMITFMRRYASLKMMS